MDVLHSKSEQLLAEFKKNPHQEEMVLSITELCREIRNICSLLYTNMEYQCGIVYYADGAILQNVIDIISNIPSINPQTENLEKCFSVGMQLIGNLVVGNIKNQEIILMKYSFFLRNMFVHDGAKNFIYMIYYNCYFGSPHLEKIILLHSEAMTELTNPNLNSEFADLFLELFLDRCQSFEHFYENVTAAKRPCLLNMIRARYLSDREKKFSPNFVVFLQNKFKSYEHEPLLQSFRSRKQTVAKEAATVLDLLSSYSSNETYLKIYQQDQVLFQYIVDLFLIVYSLGARGNTGSCDTFSKQNSDGYKLGPDSFFGNIQKNPAYLFKVNLVRLISNLTWRNTNLDNKLVETKNLIPALIDCCQMDAFNPFISEWCVFAIRNLRENHINNQRMIEILRRQGSINKQILKQMNKNIGTSNYRYCVPGQKELPSSGLPCELMNMSRTERKYCLRSYFIGNDSELLENMHFSSDSSSSTHSSCSNCCNSSSSCSSINENDDEIKKKMKMKRKLKKKYHKYSSSCSSASSSVSSSSSSRPPSALRNENEERENICKKIEDVCRIVDSGDTKES